MMAFLWLIRWLSQGYLARRMPPDVPILVFLLGAPAGFRPSYDLAWNRHIRTAGRLSKLMRVGRER
jgi:hypothetical protein